MGFGVTLNVEVGWPWLVTRFLLYGDLSGMFFFCAIFFVHFLIFLVKCLYLIPFFSGFYC